MDQISGSSAGGGSALDSYQDGGGVLPKQPSANLLTLVGDKKDAFAVVKAG